MKMFAKIKKASVKTLSLFMVLLLIASFAPVVIDAGAEEMTETLPSSVDLTQPVNGKYYFPDIGYQKHGSCVAWAAVYYQYSYEVARKNNWNVHGNSAMVFSPKYVYNYYNFAYNDGNIEFEEAYEFLKEAGAVRYSAFNDDSDTGACPIDNSCNRWYQKTVTDSSGNTVLNYDATVSSLETAISTRVAEYHKEQFVPFNENSVPTSPDITSYNDPDLNLIKSRLAAGHVLTFGTYVNCDWEELANEEDIVLKFDDDNEEGHAMTIVGYDDSIWYDFNENGIAEDWEKGAFKVANSWGTRYHNDGFVWLAYDALNAVSNYDNADYQDRTPALYNNEYYYIEVENHTPQLTVEVTVTTKDRSGFSLALQRYNHAGTIEKETFLNGNASLAGSLQKTDEEIEAEKEATNNNHVNPFKRVAADFEGRLDTAAQVGTRVFVFDYSSLAYDDLYDPDNPAVYGLRAEDLDLSYDNGSTVIEKIVWKDANGDELQTLTPNNILNSDSETYLLGTFIDDITLNKEESILTVGYSEQLVATVTHNNATQTGVVWSSSDTDIVSVNENGVVTGINEGNAIITATAMDGSGEIASCNYNVNLYNIQFVYPEKNQDARRVQFSFTVSESFETVIMHIGNREFTVTKPTTGLFVDQTILGNRIKVTFSSVNENVTWSVQLRLAQPTQGTSKETMWFELINDEIQTKSGTFNDFVFWNAKIKTGLFEGESVYSLIHYYQYISPYSCQLVNSSTLENMSCTTETPVASGMIILKKYQNKIYEIEFLVLFGDITGNGEIGNGQILIDDALKALQHASGKSEISTALLRLAADVDCNGVIEQSDAQAIISETSGIDTLNQNQSIQIQDNICYGANSVIFS